MEAAVHRDLVKKRIWAKELGRYYSGLVELRSTGDYGGSEHVQLQEAKEAVRISEKILEGVKKVCPELEPE